MNDPHWIEYIGAIGGFLGVLLASVAAWFAWKSGKEAARTAEAAERTALAAEEESKASRELLEMQREEHAAFIEERSRVPMLDAECRVFLDLGVDGAERRVILEIGWRNAGTKALVDAGFNLVVPEDVVLSLADGTGNISRSLAAGRCHPRGTNFRQAAARITWHAPWTRLLGVPRSCTLP